MKQYPVNTLTLKNGETIAYREAGKGEKTLLLIHGNMSSSVHWQPLMEALETEYRLVAPDMRGFGDSSYHKPFDSLREARVIIEDWRIDYNANRPHSAHHGLTPAEFALQWTTTHQPQAA